MIRLEMKELRLSFSNERIIFLTQKVGAQVSGKVLDQ
jgi:hypothetical protein